MAVSDRVMRHLHQASGSSPADTAQRTTATFLAEPEPRPRHYTIISVDDHLIEPAHLFEGRVPAAFADRAPHVVTLDDGRETWVYEDGFYPQVGLNAVAGRPKAEWSMEPARFDEMRRGCYDVEARMHDMDLDGVYATLCFPSLIAGFAGTIFANSKDAELGLACVRAWNDWHLDEWAGPHLDRIIPLQLAWLRDPAVAAADVRRNAERGFKAVSFPENPVDLGLPSVHTEHWDPFLRACEETQTVICLHNGSSSWTAARSPGAPLELYTSLFSVNAIAAAADWLWARIPTRFADIRVAFSEGGIGWVPMLIDRIDYVLDHSAVGSAGWDDPNLAPTDALRRNFWFCTIDIPSTMSLRDHIGIDHICLESDYPHADSTWPDTQLRAVDGLHDFTTAEVRKVTWENASTLFRHPVPADLQLPPVAKKGPDVLDLKLSGGTIVDGTGTPSRRGDVGVRDARIVAVGDVDEDATRTIDVTGLVVAPGFVDLHTHYDAQLLWDATASPSPMHGVTTVFGGNCGFTLAPAEEHVDYLARLMARVEGIPLPALQTGLPWDWKSFGDYLARVEGHGTAVNAGFLTGHSALRRVVMGADAVGEPATDDQVEQMERLLHEALDAGAMGFSTSQAPTHNDGDGNPVPSRAATRDELLRLAGTVRSHPGTQLELIIAGCLNGFSDDEVDLMTSMSLAADRPLNWNVLGVTRGGMHETQLDAGTRAAARGARIVALTLPQGIKIRLSFLSGFVLDGLPGWREIIGLPVPRRIQALGDPTVRARLDEQAHSPEAGVLANLARWERLEIIEAFTPQTRAFEGRHVGDIAEEQQKSPFDALLDIVIADELRTGLRPDFGGPEPAETWKMRVDVWRDPRAMIGGSDAGAHLDMMSGAAYSTFVVGDAVRNGYLRIEEAVRLLSDKPARLYGLRDRGRITAGAVADLVCFDPETVGPIGERTYDDLPGGASRIVAESRGVVHVLVNGTEIVHDSAYTGATPGTVLRAGRDTETVNASSTEA